MEVYKAINRVQKALSTIGITKDRKATGFGAGYNFRGIDDVYNTLSPLLAEHGLVIIPRCLERSVTERTTAKGGSMFYVVVKCEFDFVSAVDGTKHTACTYGESMDSGDKATNKAMSTAYKYACFQAFAIPTEGDNDPDAHVHPPIVPVSQVATINADEQAELVSLIKSAGGSLPVYLEKVLKLQSLADMPIADFDGRIKQLETKIAEKKAAAIQAAADRALNDEQGEC